MADTGAGERADPTFEPAVRTLADRSNGLSVWATAAFFAVVVGGALFLARVVQRPWLAVAAYAVVVAATYAPVLRTRERVILSTEEPAHRVRAEFTDLVNPVTAPLLRTADAVAVIEDADADLAARLTFSRALLPDREALLEARETGDGDVRIRYAERTREVVATAEVQANISGARIDLTVETEPVRPIERLYAGIAARYRSKLFETFGYRELRARDSVDFQL